MSFDCYIFESGKTSMATSNPTAYKVVRLFNSTNQVIFSNHNVLWIIIFLQLIFRTIKNPTATNKILVAVGFLMVYVIVI